MEDPAQGEGGVTSENRGNDFEKRIREDTADGSDSVLASVKY